MRFSRPLRFSRHRPSRLGAFGLSLVALGLAALAPTAARAQTQDLFVSSLGNNTISRFVGTGPGTFSTTATALSGSLNGPKGLAFDARGDLFTTNYLGNTNTNFMGGTVTEFAAGTTPGTLGTGTVIETGLNQPAALVLDVRGDLFVANEGNSTITEFAAGATPGTFGAANTLTLGASYPDGLAFDARGDLFVANAGTSTITEFAAGPTPGTFGAATTFSGGGLEAPIGLAFDARGDLFVANYGFYDDFGSITEFPIDPFTGNVATTGFKAVGGLDGPAGLAFDARGDLFVANEGGNLGINVGRNTVAEYAFDPAGNRGAGAFGAAQTVESGVRPFGLVFGPSVAAPVPEASTTVSLGLLLTLGLGGLVIAARRKKAAA